MECGEVRPWRSRWWSWLEKRRNLTKEGNNSRVAMLRYSVHGSVAARHSAHSHSKEVLLRRCHPFDRLHWVLPIRFRLMPRDRRRERWIENIYYESNGRHEQSSCILSLQTDILSSAVFVRHVPYLLNSLQRCKRRTSCICKASVTSKCPSEFHLFSDTQWS